MSFDRLSRRGFMKGAAVAAGALAGARLIGDGWEREAYAATGETSHVVHIMFPGGYNAFLAGCADKYVGKGTFGVSNANMKKLNGGVTTDMETLGTMPQFALDHWAAVGCRHGNTSHLGNGAEKALLFDGKNSYLNQLAQAMGGQSSFKSVHFGERMPYGPQPSFEGVSLQRFNDIQKTLDLRGGGTPAPNPATPNREVKAGALQAASDMSKVEGTRNPTALTSVAEGYPSLIENLKKPVPPTPPLTFDELKKAYGLDGSAVRRFNSMLAGAEAAIRGLGTNVVSINEPDLGVLVHWDFHQVSGGVSLNGTYSRNRMKERIIGPLKTFLDRMLNLPDKNVIVMLNGDFVRIPNGDHGDGTVVTVFGKNIKNVVSYPCDGNSRFSPNTPNAKGLWSTIAAAAKAEKNPFGAPPHAITL
jgi:hypothetical protein